MNYKAIQTIYILLALRVCANGGAVARIKENLKALRWSFVAQVRYPGYDHHGHHRTRSRRTKFSFAGALSN